MTCEHKRVMHLNMWHRDCFSAEVPHLKLEHSGYGFENLIRGMHGDGTDISVCLDCHKVLNLGQITDDDLITAFDKAQ